MNNPVNVATAIAGGVPINTDTSAGFLTAGTVVVQAVVAIQLLHPPGCFPTRPGLTGNDPTAPDNGTYVVQPGAQFTTWGIEANSLIAAGAATFVRSV